jgi:hypothetical protein
MLPLKRVLAALFAAVEARRGAYIAHHFSFET